MRYGDFVVDERRKRLLCVREDHGASDREAINTLVSLRLDGSNDNGGAVLVSGNDFYSTPRLSPDGARLCWLTWNHPNMPWDGCELWVAEIDADGALGKHEQGRGRAGGVDLPAHLGAGWRALFRLRPHRLVEPLSLARRARRRTSSGVRQSSACRSGRWA